MRQVRELLAQMKNYFNKLTQDGSELLEAATLMNKREGLESAAGAQSKGTSENPGGVGEILERGEFGLGVAPRASRPVTKIELTKGQEAE